MPLLGSGTVAATAIKNAQDAVKATWLAQNRVLSAAEIAQMTIELEAAGLNALFVHIAANITMTFTPAAIGLQTTTALGVATGPPAAPVPLVGGVGIIIT